MARFAQVILVMALTGCATNPTQCGFIPQAQGDQIVWIATKTQCPKE